MTTNKQTTLRYYCRQCFAVFIAIEYNLFSIFFVFFPFADGKWLIKWSRINNRREHHKSSGERLHQAKHPVTTSSRYAWNVIDKIKCFSSALLLVLPFELFFSYTIFRLRVLDLFSQYLYFDEFEQQ